MDDYEVLKKLGEGTQGSVFHVARKGTSLHYAMKMMHCKDQDQINFALKEIKALIQFRHEHIVAYIDFFLLLGQQNVKHANNDLSVGLVMELCQNHNLADKIKQAKSSFMESGHHPVSEQLAISWICQASDALQYIHDQGFLHRDLKPTNIFFSQNTQSIKLGDFGLATSAGFGKQSTVGTPYYFAPEILLRQTYDAKVDVWGLGVVMLELLTLRERPINSQVLENPLITESLVSDITSMGFSAKVGCLIRDMLNRYPDGRPTPSAIIRRLAGAPLPAPGISPKSSPPGSEKICSLCEVDESTIFCTDCGQSFCLPCDGVRHKNPVRLMHIRSPISARLPQSTQPTPTVQSDVIEVPSPEFPSLSAAIAAAERGTVRKIVVVGGSVLRETITISGTCPPISIVGLDPSPTIEVATSGSCVSVSGNQGTMTNIVIRQIPPRFSSTAVDICCALIVRRGSWEFENCTFASSSGFGVVCTSIDSSPCFVRCVVTSSQQAGILFTERARGTLVDCVVENCVSTGILLKKAAAPVVRGCKIRLNKETGIFCHESSGLFEKNEISKNGGCAVVIKGASASPELTNNAIFENSQAGLFCCDESTPRIIGNSIENNGKAGILVKKLSSPLVVRNSICRSFEAGVFVFESGRGLFQENEITDNANAGILVTTNANPVFEKNCIRNNVYEGVWVCKGGSGRFSDNIISGNRRGPRDIDVTSVTWERNKE